MIKRIFPIFNWLSHYNQQQFSGDIIASITVAIMIIPQSMAYALLAGLSPEIGLYASIVPMMLYALFASSRYLAVGPVALVSLMTASVMGELAAMGTPAYHTGALMIALISGFMLVLMSLARLGVLATLLGKPILAGFTSAAAIIIGLSQLKHLLGLEIPSGLDSLEKLSYVFTHWEQINGLTVTISVASVLIMIYAGKVLSLTMSPLKVPQAIIDFISKLGALLAVIIFTFIAWQYNWKELFDVNVVGYIPQGIPSLGFPVFDQSLIMQLLGPSLLIALIGTIESISVAQSLASKEREKIIPNRELFGLGVANIGSSFSGGYPITGGLSRSIVNYNAGAQTPVASLWTGGWVLLVVLFLTQLFYFLPLAVLSAIVIIAVTKLFDLKIWSMWNYSRSDAVAMLATFFAVLFFGVELGMLIGISLSLIFFLLRASKPHIAELGRIENTEQFRNVTRHPVQQCNKLLILRVDESLFFANANYIDNLITQKISYKDEIKDLILVCSGVNYIDSSALEMLINLTDNLATAGVTMHLAEVKGPVMDKLEKTNLLEHLAPGKVFLSTAEAYRVLG